MLELKVGDTIRFRGETLKIETFWNQGKHRFFKMTNGELLTDLHKTPDVEVVSSLTTKTTEEPLGEKPKSERRSGTLEVNLKKRPPSGPIPAVNPFDHGDEN